MRKRYGVRKLSCGVVSRRDQKAYTTSPGLGIDGIVNVSPVWGIAG